MIKRISFLAAATLVMIATSENESFGQGFGGFHGARGRNVVVRRGGYGYRGGYYRSPSFGYGVGYGNVGNPYGAVGGTTYVGGMRVGGGGYTGPPPAHLGPAPGPVGIDSISGGDYGKSDLRGGDKEALNKSLRQMNLPSDAGLPAAGSNDDGAGDKKK